MGTESIRKGLRDREPPSPWLALVVALFVLFIVLRSMGPLKSAPAPRHPTTTTTPMLVTSGFVLPSGTSGDYAPPSGPSGCPTWAAWTVGCY